MDNKSQPTLAEGLAYSPLWIQSAFFATGRTLTISTFCFCRRTGASLTPDSSPKLVIVYVALTLSFLDFQQRMMVGA